MKKLLTRWCDQVIDLSTRHDKEGRKGVAALTGHIVDVVQVHSQSIM